MVFSSLVFVFAFFILNLLVYFSVHSVQKRNIILLLFSMIFYSWGGVQYLFLLLGMSFVSWFCAKRIEAAENADALLRKKIWMVTECIILLGLLAVFKYTGFVLESVNAWVELPFEIPKIILPIGISFYTFQLISYVADVYKGEVKAQPAYWKILLYCSLFHQCIAGPIVRYQTVAEEIDHRVITSQDLAEGIRRFSVGLAKKAVLANACAAVSDDLIKNLSTTPVSGLWLSMLFYALQIYLDFSAYSDMAIGMGRMVGFHYLENFNYPYIAHSVQDFWRRWHISLSSFFRDYVYIPLGGNRNGIFCTVRNMLVVWFLTGLWHGASWNYILWGLYFFVFLVIERFLLKRVLNWLPKMITRVYALFVVLIGWVLFRFETFETMKDVLFAMFGADGRALHSMAVQYAFLNHLYLLLFCLVAVTPLGKWFRDARYRRAEQKQKIAFGMYFLDALIPAILIVISRMTLVGDSYNPFLYFQF